MRVKWIEKYIEGIEEIKEAIVKVKNYSIKESEKNKMLEDLGRIMNKLKNQGIAIFTDEVFYGKAPTKFLRNPEIKLQAKGLYAVLHSYSQPKELMLNPKTFVSLSTKKIRGRLLVFFPGTYENGNYRLLDARGGWNYRAVPNYCKQMGGIENVKLRCLSEKSKRISHSKSRRRKSFR